MNNRIFYHARPVIDKITCTNCGHDVANRGTPIFTIGFHYDIAKKILFIAWAKPRKGDHYNKSFGITTVNNRLDKLLYAHPNLTYGEKMPKIVNKNLDYYITSARKYFKESQEAGGELQFWI